MKKYLLILALLFGFLATAQAPDVSYISFKKYTTAEIAAIDVTEDRTYIVENTDTGVFQVNRKDGNGWVDLFPSTSGLPGYGSENQIPTTNSTADDFDYSSGFTFDGSTLKLESGANKTLISVLGGITVYPSTANTDIQIFASRRTGSINWFLQDTNSGGSFEKLTNIVYGKYVIDAIGPIGLEGYGNGTVAGTPTYGLGVDTNGNIIEVDYLTSTDLNNYAELSANNTFTGATRFNNYLSVGQSYTYPFSVIQNVGMSSGEHILGGFAHQAPSLGNGTGGFIMGYLADGTNATGGFIRSLGNLPLYIGTYGSYSLQINQNGTLYSPGSSNAEIDAAPDSVLPPKGWVQDYVANNAGSGTPLETASTTIDLSNTTGNYAYANTATTSDSFTVDAGTVVAGGKATVLLDTTGDSDFPTITNSNEIYSMPFVEGVEYYIYFENNGDRTEHSFVRRTPFSGSNNPFEYIDYHGEMRAQLDSTWVSFSIDEGKNYSKIDELVGNDSLPTYDYRLKGYGFFEEGTVIESIEIVGSFNSSNVTNMFVMLTEQGGDFDTGFTSVTPIEILEKTSISDAAFVGAANTIARRVIPVNYTLSADAFIVPYFQSYVTGSLRYFYGTFKLKIKRP